MKERLAILDIDGTLFDGNLGIEFVKSLIQRGIFNQKIGQEIFSWYDKYKNGEVEKSIAVDEIYKLYAQGLKGKEKNKIEEAALETWRALINKLYDFVPELMESLKKDNFLVLLISGSPVEMVSKLREEFNINKENVISGEVEIKNGVYTGQIISYPGSAEQKLKAVKSWLKNKSFPIDWLNSMAIGNNERDAGLMGMVGRPMAFEANEALLKEAKNKDWALIDRKTILEKVSV